MKFKTGALLLLALMIGCLVPVAVLQPAQAAQGDVEWTYNLPTPYYSGASAGAGVITHGDGTATATACGTTSNLDDTQNVTLSPGKDVQTSITGLNQGGICNGRGAAGVDGMLFYTEQLPSTPSVTKLVATKNGVVVASQSITYQCNGVGTTYYGIPSGMKVGADGNLYAIVIRPSCSSTPNLLVSLDGQTGQVRFQQSLTYASTYTDAYGGDIGVYDSGVVVAEDATSSTSADLLSYYSYSGVKNDTLSCSIDDSTDACGFSLGGAKIGHVDRLIVKPDGTTYLDSYNGTCSSRKTLKYTTSGSASSVTRPNSCAQLMQMMPSGNLVFYYNSSAIVTDGSGSTLYQGSLTDKSGYTFIRAPYSTEILIDGNGDVVALRYARLTTATTVRNLYIDKLNTNGTWSTLFSTEQLPTPSSGKFYFEYAYDVPNVAFAKDYMYLAVCSNVCSSTNGPSLYKISMPGMEEEYPRNAILNKYFTDNGEPLNYVALGDSFSSGEGVPPFGALTAISGVNECHRSFKAYPRLLDQHAGYNLNMTAFRACSGAKMENITTTGQYNETAQISSLSDETDLVTITIGGNDVEFAEVGRRCNYDSYSADCMDQLDESNQIATSQAFSDDLYDTLEAVQLAAPNAGVIVNGYPYILSTPGTMAYCGWAFQAASQAEREAVEDLVDNIDAALSSTAASLGMVFDDPRLSFDGHYPCNDYPWIHGVDFGNQVYSYHPTEEGQAQYALNLDEWLS